MMTDDLRQRAAKAYRADIAQKQTAQSMACHLAQTQAADQLRDLLRSVLGVTAPGIDTRCIDTCYRHSAVTQVDGLAFKLGYHTTSERLDQPCLEVVLDLTTGNTRRVDSLAHLGRLLEGD